MIKIIVLVLHLCLGYSLAQQGGFFTRRSQASPFVGSARPLVGPSGSFVRPTGSVVDPLGGFNPRNAAPEMHKINFGGETDQTVNEETLRLFRKNETPSCLGLNTEGFCAEDAEYDEHVATRFRQLVEKFPINSIIFDILNETVIEVPEEMIKPRFGPDFITEQSPCFARESIIYPKRGQTANGDWVFTMNQDNLQQGVKVEKCLREGTECVFGGGGLPNTACRQKYIFKKLLAMDNTGNNLVSESILLPSCCVCYVSSEFISTRIRCIGSGP